MEDTEVAQEGEFVWKIDNFMTHERNIKSSIFKFGKYDCFLDTDAFNDEDTEFLVYINASNKETVNYKTICKLCLMDGSGEEFLIRKHTTMEFKDYIVLMAISYSDLRYEKYDLLPDGVLTLRLSWYDKKESNQERGTRTASNLNTEEEPSKMLQTLSEDFGRIYESKVDTDFLLKVGDDLIPVHRTVLSARSEVFAAMFRHDTSENRSGVVDIPDVDVAVLSDVLYYVYSGQARGMSSDTICPMYVVADKYALIELRDACLGFLIKNLTVENVCDAALLAHTHGETKLEEKIVEFVKEKLEEIEETDKWKELLKFKSSLAVKLLRSALMIYKDKEKKK